MNVKLGRELITRWSFKKECGRILTGSECCMKEKGCIRVRIDMAQDMAVNQPKVPERNSRS